MDLCFFVTLTRRGGELRLPLVHDMLPRDPNRFEDTHFQANLEECLRNESIVMNYEELLVGVTKSYLLIKLNC